MPPLFTQTWSPPQLLSSVHGTQLWTRIQRVVMPLFSASGRAIRTCSVHSRPGVSSLAQSSSVRQSSLQ